ncbi:hypothetical protein ACQZV8_19260 [Magnetococcales bacterium HHB-1]
MNIAFLHAGYPPLVLFYSLLSSRNRYSRLVLFLDGAARADIKTQFLLAANAWFRGIADWNSFLSNVIVLFRLVVFMAWVWAWQ